jgi:hypothetical protein
MTTKRPFIAVYIDKLAMALQYLEKPDFRVLQALMLHMDPLGICYPGDARLALLTSHAETTVEASIRRLQQSGYIRVMIYQNPIKRKTEFVYIVSPHLHAVHESNQQLAWQYWGSAQYYENSDFSGTPEMKDSQPPPKPPSEQLPVNHRQEAPPPPPPKQPASHEGEEQGNASTNAGPAAPPAPQGAKTQRRAVTQPQSSPPLPPLPPLDRDAGKLPFGDPQDEAAAQQLHAQFRGVLTLINARRAVLRYGRSKVVAAAFVALSDKTVRNPVGLMFHNLRHEVVTPGVDDQQPVDWDALQWETRLANFRYDWVNYRQLLDRADCPDWFKDVMAYEAQQSAETPSDDGAAAVSGD